MVVLVTGGVGYIGSIVVEELVRQHHCVVVVDNLQEGHREAACPEAAFYEGDFGDPVLLGRILSQHKIEAVFHFAAETTVQFSMTDPGKYFITNVGKGITLLDMMRWHRCNRFVFSSTASIFGEPQYTPIDEAHPQRPINAYGESKLMFERILSWHHRAYGLIFNTFRYFNAAGATERLGEAHRHESHLIPLVMQAALGKRPYVEVYGTDYPTEDGTCVRDYVHVADLAQAHILALENMEKHPDGKYNLGNGEGFTVLEVIKEVERVSGREIAWKKAPRRSGDPAVLIASSEHAKSELGWRPGCDSLGEIVQSAWAWHRSLFCRQSPSAIASGGIWNVRKG